MKPGPQDSRCEWGLTNLKPLKLRTIHKYARAQACYNTFSNKSSHCRRHVTLTCSARHSRRTKATISDILEATQNFIFELHISDTSTLFFSHQHYPATKDRYKNEKGEHVTGVNTKTQNPKHCHPGHFNLVLLKRCQACATNQQKHIAIVRKMVASIF